MDSKFNAVKFIQDTFKVYDEYMGQYFDGEYCPLFTSIENMYLGTDLGSIDVPISVKDMFAMEA